MRWQRNPLYRKRARRTWSRPVLVGWMILMAGFDVWLFLEERYVIASIYGVAAAATAVYVLRRDWNA
jgi:hypothetical protein